VASGANAVVPTRSGSKMTFIAAAFALRRGTLLGRRRKLLRYPTNVSWNGVERRRMSAVTATADDSPPPPSSNLLSVEECIRLYNEQVNSDISGSESTVKFVDGTWFHKGERNGREEFALGPRIPGSVYFDLTDIACQKELFPESNPLGLGAMMPPPDLFAAAMDAFEIRNADHVVVYGRRGCHFLPRVWFTFREMGHASAGRVSVMNGSFEEWMDLGGPIETGEPDPETKSMVLAKELDWDKSSTSYQVTARSSKKNGGNTTSSIIGLDEVIDIVVEKEGNGSKDMDRNENSSNTIVLDARGSSFRGSGHMPGAIHLPYANLAREDDTCKLKPRDELRKLFEEVGVDPTDISKRIVCSCGSGVSACSLYLALEECGRNTKDGITYMYDGSWQEWSQQLDLPKVVPSSAE